MKPRRDVALAVVVWVVVVVVGTSLVWAVISRAGRGVSGADPLTAAGQSAPPSSDSATTSTRSPSPSASSSGPTSPPVAVRRSWQGAAGVVSAECLGTAIRNVGTTSNSGYNLEVDDSGPDRLRVEFRSGDGERRTRVEAVCRAGVPDFTEERKD